MNLDAQRPRVADLVRLVVVSNDDEQLPLAGRLARDQALRDTLPDDLGHWPRLQAWLEQVDSGGQVGRQVDDTLRAVGTLLVALGAVTGWLTTLGAFYYDGAARVNVAAVFGVLVVLPVLLLAASWLGVLAGAVRADVPGLAGLGATLRRLSAGRLAGPLARVFHGDGRRGLEVLLGRSGSEVGLAAVRRWLLARWSHACATAFFAATLATTLALVVFTDLAFGWSTTLQLDAPRVHRLASALALPWSWVWPQAVPGLELVETSRYFRVQGEQIPAAGAAELGRWWAFLLAALIGYGLAPRLLSLWLAGAALRRAVDRAIVSHPGPRTLLARLERSPVGSDGPPSPALANASSVAATPGTERAWQPAAATGDVVNWSGVGVSDAQLRARLGVERIHHAGAGADLEAEAALERELGGRRGVTVVVKAWEPPLLELQDFLEALEQAGVDVQVLPVRLDGAELGPPRCRDREVWARAFATGGARLVGLPAPRP